LEIIKNVHFLCYDFYYSNNKSLYGRLIFLRSYNVEKKFFGNWAYPIIGLLPFGGM
jgi:hypothetical protein